MAYYQGKVAFIFGASEGIGASVSRLLCAQGASVVAFSRNQQKLGTLKATILNSVPVAKINVVPLDINDYPAVVEKVNQAVTSYGQPYFVMNFAGFAVPGFFDQLDIEANRKMMDLNYFGTIHVIKALANGLIAQGGGHVVTCSSIAGFLGLFGYTGYCASKFAIIGFSESLRREWEPLGIRVSTLCPPNTKTPGLAEENKHKPKELLATEEKVKTLMPDEVALQLLLRLPKNDFLIIPSFDGKMAYYLNRLSPKIIDRFVKRKPVLNLKATDKPALPTSKPASNK